jgi:hypothetical protein
MVRCVCSRADPDDGAVDRVLPQPANQSDANAQKNAALFFAFGFLKLTGDANFDRLFEAQDTVGVVVKDLF